MKPMCYPSALRRYTNWDQVPLVLGLPEVCQLLGKTEQTVRRWLQSGQLKGRKIEKTWLIRRESVEKFLNQE